MVGRDFIDVMAFMAGFIREADTFIAFIEMMGRSTLDCVDRGAIALFRNRDVARNEGASKPRTFGSGAGSIMTAGTGPPSPLQPSPASAGVTVDRSSGQIGRRRTSRGLVLGQIPVAGLSSSQLLRSTVHSLLDTHPS